MSATCWKTNQADYRQCDKPHGSKSSGHTFAHKGTRLQSRRLKTRQVRREVYVPFPQFYYWRDVTFTKIMRRSSPTQQSAYPKVIPNAEMNCFKRVLHRIGGPGRWSSAREE